LSESISHARRIVGLRSLPTHDYTAVNDTVVWPIATGWCQQSWNPENIWPLSMAFWH
jgi:uncharacterized protein with HEPN domain